MTRLDLKVHLILFSKQRVFVSATHHNGIYKKIFFQCLSNSSIAFLIKIFHTKEILINIHLVFTLTAKIKKINTEFFKSCRVLCIRIKMESLAFYTLKTINEIERYFVPISLLDLKDTFNAVVHWTFSIKCFYYLSIEWIKGNLWIREMLQ